MTQTLTIPGWLPEQLSNGQHGHWRVRQEKLWRAQQVVCLYARQARWQAVRGKARLTVTLVFPQQRRRDTDNLYARCKGLVDGLVRARIIEDDDTEHLELIVRAEVRPKEKLTILELEALSSGVD